MVNLPPVRRSIMAGLHAFKGLGRLFPIGGKEAPLPGLEFIYDDETRMYGGFVIDFKKETVTFVVGPSRDMSENSPVRGGVWRLRRDKPAS